MVQGIASFFVCDWCTGVVSNIIVAQLIGGARFVEVFRIVGYFDVLVVSGISFGVGNSFHICRRGASGYL